MAAKKVQAEISPNRDRLVSSAEVPTTDSTMRIFDDEIALSYPMRSIRGGDECTGMVFYGHDWCDFSVRHADFEDELLTQIQMNMNDLYSNTSNVPSLKTCGLWNHGIPCAARYDRDNRWYRARLEDCDYALVRFIDFGNCQICPVDQIKPLTRAMAEISPPACTRCKITASQDSYLPSYRFTGTERVYFTVLGAVEPCEVVIQRSSAQEIETVPAVVTYVGQTGCILYARSKNKTVWSSKAVFSSISPHSQHPLGELVQIGRPTTVRILAAEKLPDFKTKADWVALAVELHGTKFDGLGWFYVVCEEHSVIVIDQSKGYVFVPNRLVEAGDIPVDKWYGCRVEFRAWNDTPDDNTNRQHPISSSRIKVSSVRLVPMQSKGPFLFPGICRSRRNSREEIGLGLAASSVKDSNKATGSSDQVKANKRDKMPLDNNEFFTNLSEELIQEFDLLGRDTIDIDTKPNFEMPESMEMVRENLRNELAEEACKRKEASKGGLLDDYSEEQSTSGTNFVDELPGLFKPLNPIQCSGRSMKPGFSNAECQTEEDISVAVGKFRERRAAAAQEMRQLRDNGTEWAKMMKFLIGLEEGQQKKFHELMKE